MENKKKVEDYSEERRNVITEQTHELYHLLLKYGQYKDLLVRFGQNGKYSLNNVLYMILQNPEMTLAKSMNEWERLGRHIIKGGTNMEVMAPTRQSVDQESTPDKDEKSEKAENKRTTKFHPLYVFDISQTEGNEYVPFKITKDITDEEKKNILDGVFHALSVKRYKYKFMDEKEFGENESYKIDSKQKTVYLRKKMDNQMTVMAAITAGSKAICDSYKGENFTGLIGEEAMRLEEMSRNCILAAQYGGDTKSFDFSSVENMSKEQREAFRNNLGIVCAGTKLVMDRIATAFYKAQVRETEPVEELPSVEPFRPAGANKSEMEMAF